MKANRPGQIITFYSYKGGTGRSMALANIAWILASQGKRVLMVDWDLEAPGLHRYFHPFLQDKSLTASSGIIDLVTRFEDAAIRPSADVAASARQTKDSAWYLPLANFDGYTVPLAWPFDRQGVLDLLPAGKQGPSYAARVNSFNWPGFYDRLGGGVFLEAVKTNMRKKYDYILIDSRTGVSDTAGVCSVQFPDILVVCFTLNIQSIEGAAAVAGSVQAQRTESADQSKRGLPLRIFPVPMRVELLGGKERLEQAREFARRTFDGFLDHLSEQRRGQYWGKIEIPYDPFYAYEEMLATFADTPGVTNSVLASLERLTDFLSDGDIVAQAPLLEPERQDVKALYLRGAQQRTVRSVLANRPELQAFCDTVATRQGAWLESGGNEFLLDFPLVRKLRETAELLVVLLEDKDFRSFWAASQANIRRRRMRASFLAYIVITISLVFLFVLLMEKEASQFFVEPAKRAIAGVIGAVTAQFRGSLAGKYRQSDDSSHRTMSYVTLLMSGALAGIMTIFILDSRVVSDFKLHPWQPSLFALIAGFVWPDFVRKLGELLTPTNNKSES